MCRVFSQLHHNVFLAQLQKQSMHPKQYCVSILSTEDVRSQFIEQENNCSPAILNVKEHRQAASSHMKEIFIVPEPSTQDTLARHVLRVINALQEHI